LLHITVAFNEWGFITSFITFNFIVYADDMNATGP
jgi:hypothetical protein